MRWHLRSRVKVSSPVDYIDIGSCTYRIAISTVYFTTQGRNLIALLGRYKMVTVLQSLSLYKFSRVEINATLLLDGLTGRKFPLLVAYHIFIVKTIKSTHNVNILIGRSVGRSNHLEQHLVCLNIKCRLLMVEDNIIIAATAAQ